MEENTAEKERHFFRTLIKFAILAGMVSMAVRFVSAKKQEYMGLTESEARQKFEEKLGSKIGEEKAAEVADQVIPKLKEKGVIVDDPIAEAVDEVVDELKPEGAAVDDQSEEG